MKPTPRHSGRRLLAKVSSDTKGPPGIHMEASGLWDKPGLNG